MTDKQVTDTPVAGAVAEHHHLSMHDITPDHPAGAGVIKPGYDDRLTNEDLAPLRKQTWGSYNFFAFWMSDVHSVGGYVTAGSLFALGLAAWQVLVALLVGITIVYFLCNLVARPSQATGTPYPVASRISFGVLGANIPAIIRGLIAVAWYGIQTYLASVALVLLAIKLWPGLAPYAETAQHGFAGLSLLGWIGFMIMWVAQAVVFWRGMEAIRKFIDFCGPAVYVVMFALAIYLVAAAGWENIDFNLAEGGLTLTGWAVIPVLLSAIALVVSYFSGPMLNYGDFARYGKSFGAVKKGNFLGLPVNFLVFSLLVVVTAAATRPVFGELIIDPVHTVARLDNVYAVILGALTFMIATVGINIVANFVSPAFDFSNVNPQKISWRMGGMIAAIGSVLITPWNLYNSPQTIHYTLDILGAFIGPLYGVLIADYYLVKRRRVNVDALYTLSPNGTYHYRKGYNPVAVVATAVAALAGVLVVFFASTEAATYTWFIGAGLGFVLYMVGSKLFSVQANYPTAEQMGTAA
ncbi:permease for cytosine/purines uracil thiamine allantoin [Nakamurella multipartita DSM 44233]|jgi:NCS1 family nucleobase:cation symporter-1|uniref:Permease for cytosine/purines uracil thiamine allantoin n=2 Tax=Nakamurella TaxID=53460 RepID=C8XGM1_NAKMY|nr:NCS1 family nucleobase:cation symporter-1 [Nakamurella multipartita]ACV78204.1 permease for cytosine/purines uracil thiamine allantoin [Nakamurella multipartita DSM 44233]